MVTTGAAPALAAMIEDMKNHPGQAVAQAGLITALSKLPPSISSFAVIGMQGKQVIQDSVQKQYYSNIRSAISAQNHWNQMAEDDNGKE